MTPRIAVALLFAVLAAPAAAHRSSDAFITLNANAQSIQGSWEIALRDLEAAVTIDTNHDHAVTWGELRAARSILERVLPPYLAVETDTGACRLEITDLQADQRVDGPYVWLALEGRCPPAYTRLTVRYGFLFTIDPTHRGILALTDGSSTRSAVLAPASDSLTVAAGAVDWLEQFLSFVREGAHHIGLGYDHILFLISLLLPCVLVRSAGQWSGVTRPTPALREVLLVVTAFTIAHSVTLTLSVLDVLRLPTRLTESAIAMTVLLAALNNLRPVVLRGRVAVAFGFGLVHGFGFASALGEVGLPVQVRAMGLAGFNIGVELGQLIIVCSTVPVLYSLRNTLFYRRAVLGGGSVAVASVAAVWFVQRALLGG